MKKTLEENGRQKREMRDMRGNEGKWREMKGKGEERKENVGEPKNERNKEMEISERDKKLGKTYFWGKEGKFWIGKKEGVGVSGKGKKEWDIRFLKKMGKEKERGMPKIFYEEKEM